MDLRNRRICRFLGEARDPRIAGSSGIMVEPSGEVLDMSLSHRTVRDERGVAMTEFALILPVFLLIIAGLLAFGRVFFYWIQTNHLASETARWAIVDRNPYAPTSLQDQARGSSTVEFQSDVEVCITYPESGSEAAADIGDSIKVVVQKPFSLIPLLDAGTIKIRGSSTMRIERFANNTSPTNYTDADNVGTCA